ncbi:MAG: alpha/beta hydrolase [Chitinophagaceae bacterium]
MDKNVVFQNKSIFYRVTGQGKPVVLIHGVPVDGEIWSQQAAVMEKHCRLIIPDLPGTGKSELPDNVRMEAMADSIKAILDAEAMLEVILIGHSMGGYISLAFAEKYPGMLKALGLFHSSSYADREEKKIARKKNIAFIQRQGSYKFIQQSTPGLFGDTFKKEHPEMVDTIIEKYKNSNPSSLAAYQEAMMERPDRRELLKQIDKPVLFVIGEHDSAIPFKDSMEQCHLPALSYIHILKNSGHMGMLEEVEKSNNILERFLNDTL